MSNEIETRDKAILEAISKLSEEIKIEIGTLKEKQNEIDKKIEVLTEKVSGIDKRLDSLDNYFKVILAALAGGVLLGLIRYLWSK